jgi:predicted nucleic acid-binding protein
MSVTVFVDTNVLVYLRDRSEDEKQRRAAEWMALLWELRIGRLSTQVLQEYYVQVTRKLDPPRTTEEAREDVLALGVWRPTVIDLRVMERAWTVQDRFGFSRWDALIVAAALAGSCRYLLTEDLQDGQEVEGLRIVSPFAHEPEVVLGR